jgi:hypothetical protein
MKAYKHSKNFKTALGIVLICCVFLCGCKEKYKPEIKDSNVKYLVVEGIINTGADSTIFTLSRTFKLDNKAVVAYEKGAIVNVESETGTTYVLPELLKAGNYGRPSLNLDQTKKYRLRIRTKDNREYLSDFVESRTAPPIDALKFDLKNNGLNFYADTHDPSGKSTYYRYSYIETWEYRSELTSSFKVENHQLLHRNGAGDFIDTCWHNVPSGNIVLGSTANLNLDLLTDTRLTFIPASSSKIAIEYSILVKLNVLTKEGFKFWEIMKKTTEDVGSIFDPQPSQLFGNIRSTTDPSEIVIGFVSAGTVTEKRVTLISSQLPSQWNTRNVVLDSTCIKSVKTMFLGAQVNNNLLTPPIQRLIPLDEVYANGNLVGYTVTDLFYCADCRTQGGTNKRPSYWR